MSLTLRWSQALAALAVAAVVLLTSAPAQAHSETIRSDPPNGGMVAVGRHSLTLWFDEPIGAAASTVELRTLDGLPVESSTDISNGDLSVVVETAPLEHGSYVLDWHALSLVDGHASSGTIVFGAGLRPDVVAAEGAGPPSPTLLALRWVDLTAVLVAIGALTIAGRVIATAGTGLGAAGDRIRRAGVIAAFCAAYAGVVTPFLRTRTSGGDGTAWLDQTWLTLTGTSWGWLWIAREVALLVALAAMLLWRRDGQRPAARIAFAALAGAVVVESLGGHAASLPVGSAVAALVGAAHVLAAGVWVGGLMVLILIIAPLARRDVAVARNRLALGRAFSPLAAASTVVLTATGLYQAGQHVPGLSSLGTTIYGAAVAAKLVLLGLALLFAAVNTVLVDSTLVDRLLPARPRLLLASAAPADRSRVFAGTLVAEGVVLMIAVVAAAVLTSVPTAREVSVATQPVAPQSSNVDGLFLTFESVAEGSDGRRRLILRLRSTIQPEPAPVTGIDVRVTGPGGREELVPLTEVEPGRYEGATDVEPVGDWEGFVAVHRRGILDSAMATSWTVRSAAVEFSTPLRTLTTLAAGLLLAVLAGLVLILRRRRLPHVDVDMQHTDHERSLL